MGVTATASAALGRKVGPLPVGGWAAIGIGTIVIVKLLRGGSSGGSDVVTIPDAFAGYADGGGGGGGGTTVPATSPPAGSGTPAGAPATARYRLSLTGRTQFYSTLGKLINVFGSSGTYDATKVKIGSRYFYRIKRAGVWRLIPIESKTIRVTQVQT